MLPGHAVGLSALLAIPMLAGTNWAVAFLGLLLVLLAVGLMHLVGEISEIRSSWRIAIVGLFIAPAYLIATTQVYPDLITGFTVAIIIMLIALIEQRGRLTNPQIVAGTSLLSFLPWLDAKNILVSVLILAALVVVYFRTTLPSSQLAGLLMPPVISLACLVSFNMWGFGHPLGTGQAISLFGLSTLTRTIALLFDRRQGLFIQFPVSLLGLAGIWALRRRSLVAGLTTLVVVIAFVYGNATQDISFGGGGFVGRFEWPDAPVLLAFSGVYLLELWKVRRRAVWTIAVVIGAIYLLQATPILLDEHLYYNRLAWDPVRYSGWWGGLDPSPVLGYIGSNRNFPSVFNFMVASSKAPIAGSIQTFGWWRDARTWWGLAWIWMIGATVVYLLLALLSSPLRFSRTAASSFVLASIVSAVLALSTPVLLPTTVTFRAASLFSRLPISGTSRLARGSADRGSVVSGPNWILLPGSYEATVDYRLVDGSRNAATMAAIATAQPPNKGVMTLRSRSLPESSSSADMGFQVLAPEEITIRVQWAGTGSLQVNDVRLTKNRSL